MTPARWVSLLCALLGAGFVVFGGTLIANSVGPEIAEAVAAQGWVAVEGRLTDVRLETHHGRRTTTQQVRADYTYHWQDDVLRGERVGFTAEADNIGSWQTDTHARLKAAQRAGRPVTVWVDPSQPERAVLDRTPRLGFLALKAAFALLFLAVGGVLVAVFLRPPPPLQESPRGFGR